MVTRLTEREIMDMYTKPIAWYIRLKHGIHPGHEQYSLAWVFVTEFIDSGYSTYLTEQIKSNFC
jgi:hypothetical protein